MRRALTAGAQPAQTCGPTAIPQLRQIRTDFSAITPVFPAGLRKVSPYRGGQCAQPEEPMGSNFRLGKTDPPATATRRPPAVGPTAEKSARTKPTRCKKRARTKTCGVPRKMRKRRHGGATKKCANEPTVDIAGPGPAGAPSAGRTSPTGARKMRANEPTEVPRKVRERTHGGVVRQKCANEVARGPRRKRANEATAYRGSEGQPVVERGRRLWSPGGRWTSAGGSFRRASLAA
jgi:hypothetical protein